MKVSDRNEVVIEGVVRRNRSLSGDAAADLDIQVQSRRRRSRGRKTTWQHDRFDVRMSGSKAKAKSSRVRRGCIVRVSGHLRSTDVPDSKTYIEAEDIDVLRQPASKRGGPRKKPKAKVDETTPPAAAQAEAGAATAVEEGLEKPAAPPSQIAEQSEDVTGTAAVADQPEDATGGASVPDQRDGATDAAPAVGEEGAAVAAEVARADADA